VVGSADPAPAAPPARRAAVARASEVRDARVPVLPDVPPDAALRRVRAVGCVLDAGRVLDVAAGAAVRRVRPRAGSSGVVASLIGPWWHEELNSMRPNRNGLRVVGDPARTSIADRPRSAGSGA
jgi:hypothetical protein